MFEERLPDGLSNISCIKSIFSILTDYISSIENIFAKISEIAIFIMMAVIFINVVGRYIFNSPLTDMMDYVELYLMPITIFLYMAILDRKDGNVGVNIVRKKLTARTKYLLDIPMTAFVMVVFFRVFTTSLDQGITTLERGQTTGVNDVLPVGITWIIIAVGILLLLVRLTIKILSMLYEMSIQMGFYKERCHD